MRRPTTQLLTRAVMSSAEGLGAELAMPARFCAATLTKTGCSIDFEHDGRPRSCFARVLVNAAGPWAPAVLDAVRPAPPRRQIELVQGAHIEVAGALQRGIYYLESPEDGRAVFVIPWRGHTLVGTTETPFEGDPELVRALPEEERYLVAVLQHYFPRREPIGPHDILCSWAGLRVLPAGGKRAFRRTRETIFDVDRRARRACSRSTAASSPPTARPRRRSCSTWPRRCRCGGRSPTPELSNWCPREEARRRTRRRVLPRHRPGRAREPARSSSMPRAPPWRKGEVRSRPAVPARDGWNTIRKRSCTR